MSSRQILVQISRSRFILPKSEIPRYTSCKVIRYRLYTIDNPIRNPNPSKARQTLNQSSKPSRPFGTTISILSIRPTTTTTDVPPNRPVPTQPSLKPIHPNPIPPPIVPSSNLLPNRNLSRRLNPPNRIHPPAPRLNNNLPPHPRSQRSLPRRFPLLDV